MIHSDKKYVIWIVFGALSLILPRAQFPFHLLSPHRRVVVLAFARSVFPHIGCSCSGLLGIFSCVEYRKFSYFLLLVYGASHFYVLLAWFFARLFPLSFPFSIHYHCNNFFFAFCCSFSPLIAINFQRFSFEIYLRIKCFFGCIFRNEMMRAWIAKRENCVFAISNLESSIKTAHIEFVSRFCSAELNRTAQKHYANKKRINSGTIKIF